MDQRQDMSQVTVFQIPLLWKALIAIANFMSALRNYFILAVLILTLAVSCTNKKEKIFYAFTDGFMDWYSLELYPDRTFSLHVPVADYSGTYKIIADTILLAYNKDTIGTGHAPIAYLIQYDKKKVDELEFDGQKHQIRQHDNRWIQIMENRLP